MMTYFFLLLKCKTLNRLQRIRTLTRVFAETLKLIRSISTMEKTQPDKCCEKYKGDKDQNELRLFAVQS